MRKMALLTGAAIGYVLGARAGRERYEQICRAAGQFKQNDKVQQATEMVTQRGGEIAHTVTEKTQSMAGAVAEKAPGWMPGSRSEGESSGGGTSTSPGAMSTGTGVASPAMQGGMNNGRT